jgi:hypothetical protein
MVKFKKIKTYPKKKKNISIQGWGDLNFCGELSFTHLSFFLKASTIVTYFFIVPICKVIVISLKPCALNVDFQHLVPKFNRIFLLYGYPWNKGLG